MCFYTKEIEKYQLHVTPEFTISVKRVNYSWKNIYGVIKVPSHLLKKQVTEYPGFEPAKVCVLIRLLPLKKFMRPFLIRHLLKSKKVNLLESGKFFEFADKPIASNLDVVAANLKIAKGFYEVIPEDAKNLLPIDLPRDLIFQLRRKLRKHRIYHLGLIKKDPRMPHTNEGRAVQLIFDGLNKMNNIGKITRSARKRQNRLRKQKALEYKLKKMKERIHKREMEKVKELNRHKKYERLEALIYLNELKTIEKYSNFDEKFHLDLLFSSTSLERKITTLLKEFYDFW
jgi:hypothetical protein